MERKRRWCDARGGNKGRDETHSALPKCVQECHQTEICVRENPRSLGCLAGRVSCNCPPVGQKMVRATLFHATRSIDGDVEPFSTTFLHQVTPVFQPIANLLDASLYGFEALARGPASTALHDPENLFAAARAAGCDVEFELRCCLLSIREFAKTPRTGKLLLNMSAGAILASASSSTCVVDWAKRFGLLPSRLVIELTEHDRVRQIGAMKSALGELRAAGVGFALDDFGDGRSSLRMWTELRPDLVKIDKYFVRDVHRDNEKFEVLRVFRHIAETFGGILVAEGIENSADLAVLRDMGVGYGQGFLLGRPAASPVADLPQEVVSVLLSRKVAVFPEIKETTRGGATTASLVIEAPSVSPETTNDDLIQRFRRHPNLHAFAVVSGGKPVGLVNRQAFMDRYAQTYFKELYGRRGCSMFMNPSPLIVERDTSLLDLIDVLRGDDQRYLVDGFVICSEGYYVGLGTGDRLVRAVSELRIEAARHANPLTALPGNIPISQHIARLLERQVEFVACYCDLSNFKPFNDCYGYWRGDEVIRLAAGLLVANCDPLHDFVGHVGGDDFVLLMQSEDWKDRCQRIIEEFNGRALGYYDEVARRRGGIDSEDRHGNACFFPLTTMAVGAVCIQPGDYSRHEDVASAAAAAKRRAKHDASGFIFCECKPGTSEGASRAFSDEAEDAGQEAAPRMGTGIALSEQDRAETTEVKS